MKVLWYTAQKVGNVEIPVIDTDNDLRFFQEHTFIEDNMDLNYDINLFLTMYVDSIGLKLVEYLSDLVNSNDRENKRLAFNIIDNL